LHLAAAWVSYIVALPEVRERFDGIGFVPVRE
jgi:hypothetical protein